MKGVVASIFLLLSAGVFAANQADVDKFNQTNECHGCDLSNIAIDGSHSGAKLAGSIFDGSRFWMGNFTRCDMSNSFMNGVNAQVGTFSHCSFRGAQMTQSNFSGSDFSNADLTGAILTRSNFTYANFLGAKVSKQQLNTASNICESILPDGSVAICN